MKYRKKPVEIEAVRYDGYNSNEISKFMDKPVKIECISSAAYEAGMAPPVFCVLIETLEGIMRAMPGDYIIKGVKGEFYPCKPDIFEQTYEPVTE